MLDEIENLTPLGRHAARLPVDARVAKLLIYAAMMGVVGPALTGGDRAVVLLYSEKA